MDSTSPSIRERLQGDGWLLRQTARDDARRDTDDTLFALANGSLGVRGGFEETAAGGDGCFLAAAYERHPIHYHERFPGFARSTDTRVPVADGRRIVIRLDGETLDLDACEWLDFKRELDLRRGTLRRRLRLRTPLGATLQIDSERFVALDQDLLAIRYRVASIDWRGTLTLESSVEAGRHAAGQGDDPRIGAASSEPLLTLSVQADSRIASLVQRTRRSGIAVYCAQVHRASEGLQPAASAAGGDFAGQSFQAELAPGDAVTLEKFIAYAATAPDDADAIAPLAADAERRLAQAASAGYDALLSPHAQALSAFWERAGIAVEGDPDSEFALRFNLFHLLQSASRTSDFGTAAKGLTGEGYEGHCFWDTEAFVLPVMAFVAPEIARTMLLYRHRRLDAARANARELNHARGALYPWRTIAGAECSGHYPTGSAEYHINAAIAYAIGLYLDATGDEAFLLDAGAEILFETARIWPQAGHFDPLRGGGFAIHGVTGPDEYSVLVDNNFYTNRMAQRHLRRAAEAWERLRERHPQRLAELASRLSLEQREVDEWRRIADAMLLPVDPQLDVYAQDDTFLHKPRWPHADAESGRPLLLHYHPLTLFRHQISKQADLVMALMLAGDGLDPARKRRSFEHYEAVTTHDSTLSAAVHGIVAAEVGLPGQAWRFFRDALRVDLDDLHGNTAHGVHMAAMAGSWLGLSWGFAGLRVVDGVLHFAPTLPQGWNGYGFGLQWRGRTLRIDVARDGVRYRLPEGEALDVVHAGEALRLVPGENPVRPLAGTGAVPIAQARATFPRRCRALVFDLDGVLTDTAHVHYRAWKRLADEIGVPFDEVANRRLKGVSRAASLDILLERAPRAFDADEKAALMERKNGYYREAIASFGPGDLFAGARELLRDARDAGLRIALASASRNAPELLRRLGIANAFDAVVDASRIANQKPDPEIFLAAAQALGVDPGECIGIEDAAAGVAAIKSAGMAAVGIGDPRELRQADAVLPAIADFRLDAFVLSDAVTVTPQ